MTGLIKEGWYGDPSARHEYRWFSQGKPTDLVKDGTATSSEPLGITDAVDYESMDLARPPDDGPALQSGAGFPDDVYDVGAAWRILDPPPNDVQRLVRHMARRPLAGGKWVWWVWWAVAGVVAAWGLSWAHYLWTTPSGLPSGPVSYLLASRADLVFVQWKQPMYGGEITGTITVVSLVGKPPAETVNVQSSYHFAGQLYGSRRGGPSVSINGVLLNGVYGSLAGTFQNGKLVIQIPHVTDNGYSTDVLVRSDIAAYNAALRMLTAQSHRADQLAAASR